ncbi:hypothetical protein TNCV_4641231 [Trichonephila clavipes]|nr:hypothetical protein TNCV_4641231 [Trichonephila clavipes]
MAHSGELRFVISKDSCRIYCGSSGKGNKKEEPCASSHTDMKTRGVKRKEKKTGGEETIGLRPRFMPERFLTFQCLFMEPFIIVIPVRRSPPQLKSGIYVPRHFHLTRCHNVPYHDKEICPSLWLIEYLQQLYEVNKHYHVGVIVTAARRWSSRDSLRHKAPPAGLRCQIEAHKIHRGRGLILTPVVRHSFEHHTRDSTIWHGSTPILRADQRPPTSVPLPPTSKEEMRLDEYFKFPHAAEALYTLRHSSQRH